MKIKIALIGILLIVILESVGLWAYNSINSKENVNEDILNDEKISVYNEAQEEMQIPDYIDLDDPENQKKYEDILAQYESASFPIVQIEEVDGNFERTIHMGVRQWAWDPFELKAELNEKVRLVIHNNSDYVHNFEMPEFEISSKITSDGSIIEFMASKEGEFVFYCEGADHEKVEGAITIIT